jgi:hypothetical protein
MVYKKIQQLTSKHETDMVELSTKYSRDISVLRETLTKSHQEYIADLHRTHSAELELLRQGSHDDDPQIRKLSAEAAITGRVSRILSNGGYDTEAARLKGALFVAEQARELAIQRQHDLEKESSIPPERESLEAVPAHPSPATHESAPRHPYQLLRRLVLALVCIALLVASARYNSTLPFRASEIEHLVSSQPSTGTSIENHAAESATSGDLGSFQESDTFGNPSDSVGETVGHDMEESCMEDQDCAEQAHQEDLTQSPQAWHNGMYWMRRGVLVVVTWATSMKVAATWI